MVTVTEAEAEMAAETVMTMADDPGIPIGGKDSLYSLRLRSNLSEEDREKAMAIIRWLKGSGVFYGIAGLMLVTGMPRQGKGLFANVFAYEIKRLFIGKRILRDDKPKPIFGDYTFFNEDVLMEDITRMKELSDAGDGGKAAAKMAAVKIAAEAKTSKQKADMQRATKEWVSSRGEVMFKDAVVVLDEFWRYMSNRRPMSPMNLTLGGIIKMWGHLDCLLMGLAQRQHDLDRFTCLPYVTHEAKCSWSRTRENTVEVHLYRTQYSTAKQALVPTDKPTVIYVDGGRARSELGGQRYFDIYNSKAPPMFDFGLTKRKGEM